MLDIPKLDTFKPGEHMLVLADKSSGDGQSTEASKRGAPGSSRRVLRVCEQLVLLLQGRRTGREHGQLAREVRQGHVLVHRSGQLERPHSLHRLHHLRPHA